MSSEDLRHQDSGLPVEPALKGILSIAIIDLIKDKSIAWWRNLPISQRKIPDRYASSHNL